MRKSLLFLSAAAALLLALPSSAYDYGAGYNAPHVQLAALDNHAPPPVPFSFADFNVSADVGVSVHRKSFAAYRAVLTVGRLIDARAEIRQRTLSRLA